MGELPREEHVLTTNVSCKMSLAAAPASHPALLLWFGNLAQVNILEPQRSAMVLQLNISRGENRLIVVPVIFQRRIAHDHLAVKKNVDLFASHQNAKSIPFSHGTIRNFKWMTRRF